MSLEAALVQQQRRRHAARAGAHDDRAPACAKAGRNRRVELAACAGVLGATDLHPAGMRADAPVARSAGADKVGTAGLRLVRPRSEEHTSELPSLMRTSYAVFWLKKKTNSQLG